ncbi:MAG: hypothetical protein M1288_03625 [Actinobacteria bacterium]|nr:hypothetical protein [Actinomycetota bacterium]
MVALLWLGVILVVGLVIALVLALSLVKQVRTQLVEIGSGLERLDSQLGKLLKDVSVLVEDANLDVNKFEILLDSAGKVADSMGSASKLAFSAVAAPIVRVRALRAGMDKLISVFRLSGSSTGGKRRR